MKTIKKKELFVSIIQFSIIILFMSCSNGPENSIDYRKKLTDDCLDKIELYMTIFEAKRILGEPHEAYNKDDGTKLFCYYLTQHSKQPYLNLVFVNDKLFASYVTINGIPYDIDEYKSRK